MTRPRGYEEKGSAREGAELDISTFQCLQPSLFNPSSCQNCELLSSPKCSHVALCDSGTLFFFFFLVSMSFVKSVAFCCHHVAGHGRVLLTLPVSFSLSLPGAQARNHMGEVTSSGLTQSLSWSVFRVQILPAVGSCLSPDLLLPALSRVHGSAMTPEKENPGRSHLLTSAGTDGRCCHPGLWDVSPSQ